MSKRPLVVGNWKMYVEMPQEAKKLASALRRKARTFSGVEVVLAPAFPLVPIVAAALKGSSIKIGAQTLSAYADGQHTGEISAAMLKAVGASFVIVGHSERRSSPAHLGESDASVRAQLVNAHAAGLTAVLCVGEQERDSANGTHFTLVAAQLTSALQTVAPKAAAKLVVAYEPVWAIGKSANEAMRPADLREMVIFIRKTLADILGRTAGVRVPILYGGSVEGENASQLLHEGGVSGFLVGRASANADSFLEILKVLR